VRVQAVARNLGTVRVRQYAKSTHIQSKVRRTIVDFEDEETTMRYLLLTDDGGLFRLGVETLELSWPDMVKLARLIARTGRKLSAGSPVSS
jgi:hypothetical protein